MASLTGSVVLRKASDQTVNNSTTLVNDADLLIAMGANEVWYFEAMIIHIGNNTAGLKIAFTVPSGATLSWVAIYMGSSTTDTRIELEQVSGTAVTAIETGTINHPILAKGMVRVSSTAGNLQLQWAQNTATAVDTKVLTDSWLMGARES